MKWVTRALTTWNVLAPAVSLGAMAYVDLSPSLDYGGVSEDTLLPFAVLGAGWMLGTPITAGLALLLNRWAGERWLKWTNVGLIAFWIIGAPAVMTRFYM